MVKPSESIDTYTARHTAVHPAFLTYMHCVVICVLELITSKAYCEEADMAPCPYHPAERSQNWNCTHFGVNQSQVTERFPVALNEKFPTATFDHPGRFLSATFASSGSLETPYW